MPSGVPLFSFHSLSLIDYLWHLSVTTFFFSLLKDLSYINVLFLSLSLLIYFLSTWSLS
ncbi:hypothetical protein B9Z19DRAFT_1085329 [Tuber borchii]|uniref:Uncharacterized protein n=1 Tax=Tuber borchii TaxID=42251 RepID=A0A2T6ZQZ8_TUBBO|nr:hypothetical protein B9Z19DRAFT_1085329 [Tuber borchii]